VIAVEPDLGQRAKAVVLRDLIRRQVAVVVDDRLLLRHLMIEPPRRLRLQQEIGVDEGLH
jgi:hypothetical protein